MNGIARESAADVMKLAALAVFLLGLSIGLSTPRMSCA